MPHDEETWCLWELMGATTGPTRGELAARIQAMAQPERRRGWELVLPLASIGSDGHWPQSMALWRVPDRPALQRWLDAGFDDGLDETGVRVGRSRLYRRLRGTVDVGHHAWLVEHVRCESRAALAALPVAADAVLAELLAPAQGLVLWGAADLGALAQREYRGIGCGDLPGVVECTGWWAAMPPQRTFV